MADLAALWIAVRNRALDDDGAGGLFAPQANLISGIYENDWPESAQLPIVVYDVASTNQIDAFRAAVYEVDVRFGIYVKTDPVVSTEASALASRIINRIRGDWQDQSAGTAPTYGFHRWSPGTLTSSEWSARDFRHLSSRAEHSQGVLHYIEAYRAIVQQAAA